METKKTTTEKKQSELLSELNLLLLDNNLNNDIVYKLNKLFYQHATECYKKGTEQTKSTFYKYFKL